MRKETGVSSREERLQGTVLNFLKRKGYGFIRTDDQEKIFVHFSDIRGKDYRTLEPGEAVEFSLRQGERGLQAFDVVRLDPPAQEDVEPMTPERTW